MTMRQELKLIAAGLALGLAGCVSLGTYNDLQKKASDMQSQLDEIHREAKGLQSDLGSAKQSNEALSLSKTALETETVDLQKQKAQLETTQASLEVKTSQLETRTAELEDEAAQLETKTAQLEAAKAALEADKAALEADKAALLKQAQDKQAQYDSVMGQLKQEVNDGQLKITQYKNMLTLDVADKILFDSGKAALKKDGRAVLLKVGQALAKGDKVIRVVGHTDNVPLAEGAAFASNWDLSTARATTVVRFLQDQCKLDPTRLVAEGRGEWLPVAPNDTPENRQKNRRIEITLIDRSLVDAISAVPAGTTVTAAAAPATSTAATTGAK